MDNFRVYFRNKVLIFTAEEPSASEKTLHVVPSTNLSPAKLLKKSGNSNTLYVISKDPAGTFVDFCAKFNVVDAAGGLVENGAGDVLMISRNGWWDLPKGHVEQGESHVEAALREVAEETGLDDMELGELITVTQHFYLVDGRWEMKRSWWYGMTYRGAKIPTPQIFSLVSLRQQKLHNQD